MVCFPCNLKQFQNWLVWIKVIQFILSMCNVAPLEQKTVHCRQCTKTCRNWFYQFLMISTDERPNKLPAHKLMTYKLGSVRLAYGRMTDDRVKRLLKQSTNANSTMNASDRAWRWHWIAFKQFEWIRLCHMRPRTRLEIGSCGKSHGLPLGRTCRKWLHEFTGFSWYA